MKSRIASRFLLIAVMALVLGALLAVSSFAAAPAPTGLTFNGVTGLVEGLDPDTDYYYAPYTIKGAGEKQYAEDGAETLELTAGLWGIGIASNDPANADSLPCLVYVRGDAADREVLGVIGGDNKPAFGYTTSTTGPDWNVGKWIVTGDQWSACTLYDTDGYYVFNDTSSGVSNTTYKPTTLYSYQETLKTNPNDTATAAALLELQTEMAEKMSTRHISYAYDATEIIPVNELLSASFAVRFVQGGLSFKKVNSKLAVYVMDSNGVVTPYEWTSEQWSAAAYHGVKKHTVNVQSITNLPDEGWVVGIAFYPYAVVEPYSIVAAENNDTQRQTRIGFYYNEYTLDLPPVPAPTPTFEVSANAQGNGFDVIITNVSEKGIYEYKTATSDWTAITDGKFTVATTGTYIVKVSGDAFLGAVTADVVVEKLTPTAPVLNYEVNSADDFKVIVTNASKIYDYEYKTEADSTWKAVEGTTFVATDGTYSVRAFGDIWNGYATANITVSTVAPVAPKVTVVPRSDTSFTINIKNHSDLYKYQYKLNTDTNWTDIPSGENTFIITSDGEYTIRAGGNAYNGWAETPFKGVEVPAEITNLTIVDGVLMGLDTEKAYEYAKVNYEGVSDQWTAIPAGTEYTFENPGLYAVRLAETATEDASAAMVFNKLGSLKDRGTIFNTEKKNYSYGTNVDVIKWASFSDRLNPQFSVGKWTGWNVDELQQWSAGFAMAIGSANWGYPYADLGAKLTDGTMTQGEVRDFVESIVYKYAYEDSEIIPFADLEKLTVKTGCRVGHIYTGGETFAKFVVYVANNYGEIETREITRKAQYGWTGGSTAQTQYTISPSDFEDTTGYIVAIDIYPFGYIPEETTFTVEGTGGITYVTYFNDYQVKLPKMAAPSNIVFNENTGLVEGFDANTKYYYAPYTVNGAGETKYVEDGAETLLLSVGLWGVGIISDDPEYDNSLPCIVYVRGDEADREVLGVIGGDNKPAWSIDLDATTGPDWDVGKWIATGAGWGSCSVSDAGYYDFVDDNLGIPSAEYSPQTLYGYQETLETNPDDTETEAKQLELQTEIATQIAKRYIAYAYDATEILPVDELLRMSFAVRFRQGGLSFTKVNSKVVVHVMGTNGEVTPYEWTSDQWSSSAYHAVQKIEVKDVQSIENLPDEGWIVGIEFYPFAEVDPSSIKATENNTTQRQAYVGFYYTDYSIKLQAEAPALTTLEAPNALGFGEIAGFNARMAYEYREYDEATGTYGEWLPVPEGSTSIRLPAGKYQVRVADSKNYIKSDPVDITILSSDVERVSLMNETKKIYLPNEFIELSANYEIDTTSKIWVSRLALDNIKTISPNSTVTIIGDRFKYVVLASNIATDKMVHYYNFDITFDGESKYDTSYEDIVELTGDNYIMELFTESSYDLPFKEAQLYILVGTEYNSEEVELRSYNERIGKLRKGELATVKDGWAMFTNFGGALVIVSLGD